jgi:hypothetical protein
MRQRLSRADLCIPRAVNLPPLPLLLPILSVLPISILSTQLVVAHLRGVYRPREGLREGLQGEDVAAGAGAGGVRAQKERLDECMSEGCKEILFRAPPVSRDARLCGMAKRGGHLFGSGGDGGDDKDRQGGLSTASEGSTAIAQSPGL